MSGRSLFSGLVASCLMGLSLAGHALEITTTSLPDGEEMVPYNFQLQAASGVLPYKWSVHQGMHVWSWDNNYTDLLNVPDGLSDIVQIDGGEVAFLALSSEGRVYGWGSNYYGQLDIPFGLTDVVQVDAGYFHCLALKSDGTVVSWPESSSMAKMPEGLDNVAYIFAGNSSNYAVKRDGTVVGWDKDGLLDLPAALSNVKMMTGSQKGNFALTHDGEVLGVGTSTVSTPLLHNIKKIAARRFCTVALSHDGYVYDFNDYERGKPFEPVANVSNVVDIARGVGSWVAVKNDGTLASSVGAEADVEGAELVAVCRGYAAVWRNAESCLPAGLSLSDSGVISGFSEQAGTNRLSLVVQDDQGATTLKRVELSVHQNINQRPVFTSRHPESYFLNLEEGGVEQQFDVTARDPEGQRLSYSWFLDGASVGNDSPSFNYVTVWEGETIHTLQCFVSDGLWITEAAETWEIRVLNKPLSILSDLLAVGREHAFYLQQLIATNGVQPYSWSAFGLLEGWGGNRSGQLDIPEGLVGIKALSAGQLSSYALKDDGTVVGWGSTYYGLMNIPQDLADVREIAAGDLHCLALKNDGTVVSWGYGNCASAPNGVVNVQSIAAGQFVSILAKKDGSVLGWNDEGTLTIPAGLNDVMKLSVSRNSVYALKNDGSVVAWSTQSSPQLVDSGLSNVVHITDGQARVAALKNDGTAYWLSAFSQAELIEGLSDVVSLSTSHNLLVALKSDGNYVQMAYGSFADDIPGGMDGIKLMASGVGHTIVYRDAESCLPEGLELSGSGVISGIPVSAGTNEITITVEDVLGESTYVKLPIVVEPNTAAVPIITGSFPDLEHVLVDEGQAAAFNVIASNHGGGLMSYAWMLDGEPVGADSMDFEFLPDWQDIGEHELKCYVSDVASGSTVFTAWTVDVKDIPVNITTMGSLYAVEMTPFSFPPLEAIGGTPPLVWEVSGYWPEGVGLSVDGVITGQVDDVSVKELKFKVTDATGSTDYSGELSLVVAANLNTRPVIDAYDPVKGNALIAVGSSSSFSVQAHDPEGETLQYRWMLGDQEVGTDSYTYTLAGTSENIGTRSLKCFVSDGFWTNHVSRTWEIVIVQDLVEIVTSELPSGMEMVPYSYQLESINEGNPFTWSASEVDVVYSNGRGYAMPVFVRAGDEEPGQNITAMSAGDECSIVLHEDGTVVYSPQPGEMGFHAPYDYFDVKAVAAGRDHLLVVNGDGSVVTWHVYGDELTEEFLKVPADLKNVTAVAANSFYSLALTGSGTVAAWGDNSDGECDVPADLCNVKAIAAGVSHCMALKDDGQIVAWGLPKYNNFGQANVPEDLQDAQAIAAGRSHSLALLADGTVRAWGRNEDGECSVPAGLNDVIAISAGGRSSIALKSDGTTVAWGLDVGANGLENVTAFSMGDEYCMVKRTNEFQLPPGLEISDQGLISGIPEQAGTYQVDFRNWSSFTNSVWKTIPIVIEPNPDQAPVIDSNSPDMDEVHVEETTSTLFSVSASDPEGDTVTYRWTLDGVEVATAASYTFEPGWGDLGPHDLRCYVSEGIWQDVVFKQWKVFVDNIPMEIMNRVLPQAVEGEAYYAALEATNGVPPYSWALQPQAVSWGDVGYMFTEAPENELSSAVSVDTGYGHYVALLADGTVRSWGRNSEQQADVPEGLTDVVCVAAGGWHSVAVKSDGSVVTWGQYNYGSAPINAPQDLHDVVSVSAGGTFDIALLSTGTVISWGQYPKTPPSNLEHVDAIEAGGTHCLALKTDGTVVAWGDRSHSDNNGPCDMPEGLQDVVDIAAGFYFSLALKSDGTVVAWGKYSKGQSHQLGLLPMYVPEGLSDVVEIAAGYSFAVAVKSDGSVVTWGNTEMYPRATTVPASLPNVHSIAAGYSCIALREDSTRLPSGLTLSEDGIISGTPLESVTNEVTFIVRDALGETVEKTLGVGSQALLLDIAITGPDTVNEDAVTDYSCIAEYTDGSFVDVSDASDWSEDSNYASITETGELKADVLTSYMPCNITAAFEDLMVDVNVTIMNSEGPYAPMGQVPAEGGRLEKDDPVISWTAIPGVNWYRVVVLHYQSGGLVAEERWIQNATQMKLNSELAKGQYIWWVIGMYPGGAYSPWSAASRFCIGVPGIPQPVAPVDTGILIGTRVDFVWTTAASNTNDQHNTWYHLVIRDELGHQVTSDTIGSAWFVEQADGVTKTVGGNQVVAGYLFGGGTQHGNFTWLVQAVDATGSSLWSDVGHFAVGRQITPGTIGAGFGEGEDVYDAQPTFEWASVSWATHYDVMLESVASPEALPEQYELFENIPAKQLVPGTPLIPGSYVWRVRAKNIEEGWIGSWGPGAAFQYVPTL